MKRLIWRQLGEDERTVALARPARRADADVAATVARIFDEVAAEGEAAVRRWAVAIDGAEPARLELTPARVDAARAALAPEDLAAIELAADQVRFFHEATRPEPRSVEMRPGVRCTQSFRPLGACGLYVPGGQTPLVSTLIMLAEPARVAGVGQRIVVTPPGKDGAPHPGLIAAAAVCGLERLWLIGGAQAIAALSFGAFTPKAQKIFGPGNIYVSEAKRRAAALPGGPAIDLPAGPSELMVVADRAADAELVAADLLAQAEHDADAQVMLVALSDEIMLAVEGELVAQLEGLPRKEIARRALSNARFIRANSIDEAVEIANLYAPEHLSLHMDGAESVVARIETAGAVFVGAMSAETFGDYLAGPSHVLPTDGAGRVHAGITTAAFMRAMSVQELDAQGARALAPAAARLARLEGLEAHARGADLRAARATGAAKTGAAIRRRRAEIVRETRETAVRVIIDLDRAGPVEIETGLGFYDHMLQQIATHGGFALNVRCTGDLHVDGHHTIEDVALALGAGLAEALGDRRGIARFGFMLPMDEAEARISIDLSGRPYLVFEGAFKAAHLGVYPTEMTEHVFRALSQAMGAAIHVAVSGENDHHKTEACFKALGRALRQAVRIEGRDVPSSKGVL